MFRSAFQFHPDRAARVMALNEKEALGEKPLLVKSLVVVGLVLAGFAARPVLGLAPSVVAMLGAGLLVLLARLETRKVFADVEWETLLFFAGLFIMVGSLVNLGVIESVGNAMAALIGDQYGLASMVVLGGSALVSGIIDNIPYVATLAPITQSIVEAGGDPAKPLWWALALGADLGGNATAVGASANVVVIGIARRYDHPISFWTFTKYGLVVTAVTIGLCLPYLYIRYYMF